MTSRTKRVKLDEPTSKAFTLTITRVIGETKMECADLLCTKTATQLLAPPSGNPIFAICDTHAAIFS